MVAKIRPSGPFDAGDRRLSDDLGWGMGLEKVLDDAFSGAVQSELIGQ